MSTTGTAGADERSAGLGARGVRQRREGEVHVADLLADRQVVGGEVREDIGERLAGGAAPADADELCLGMRVQQARELGAGVAGDVDDSYFDHELCLQK